MLKKTITYTDYNGVERKEDFYFNFTKAELTDMNLSVQGGLREMIQKIIDTQDVPGIAKIFKEIIFKAYGEKSADGRRFVKTLELAEAFSQTEAYSELYMELATDSKAAAEFVNGIMPADLVKEAEKESKVIEGGLAKSE